MAKHCERLREALDMRDIKPSMLSYKTGISEASISHYLAGHYEPKSKKLHLMAKALKVSTAWLSGLDVPMEENLESDLSVYGIRPIKRKSFPLLGEIACGKPVYASENFESFIDASADIDADFCLTARGESMIDARIKDGDIVFIKKQPVVQNGEIAAVIIDGEATLKKWFYYPDKQKLVLNPANVNFEPLVYTGAELETIICLGKAVTFMSNL